jgi:ribonuclease VapC
VILDSSAIVAILLRQPGYESLLEHLTQEPSPGAGAPTLVETGIVLTAKLGASGHSLLARFVKESGLEILPFGEEHWEAAVQAFQRFGKGRHPARLNFGDCLTYATAQLTGEPLLCIGEDFVKTDLVLAS